jgi:hypothetical protein
VTPTSREDNERLVGRTAAWHGAILVVIGLVVASHAVVGWPWVTAVVDWLRRLD